MVDIKPVMFKYYKTKTEEDFYKPVAIIGCRRIPNYHLAWSQASLCYDQFVPSIMSRNRFERLMEFLHIVDSSTEQALVQSGDKLAKVCSLNDQLGRKMPNVLSA